MPSNSIFKCLFFKIFTFVSFFTHLLLCYLFHVHGVGGTHTHAMVGCMCVCVCGPEDNLSEPGLSFHHVASGIQLWSSDLATSILTHYAHYHSSGPNAHAHADRKASV